MRATALRLTALVLLVGAGLGAGYFTARIYAQAETLLTAERELDARLDRAAGACADLGAAQQAYVAPGQPDEPWFARVTALMESTRNELGEVRARLRTPNSTPKLQAALDAIDAFARVDSRARDYILLGQEFMAADLIFSEGRQALGTARTALDELRSTELAATRADRDSLVGEGATVLGAAALIWIAGLAALVRVPRPVPARTQAPAQTAAALPTPATPAPIDEFKESRNKPLDLEGAARTCTSLSRVTSASELSTALADAARIIDANGVIVWLGAGEELFAATAHGYPQSVLARLGPIPRDADNATAAVWRDAELRTVAGDAVSNGAIVAPMFGPSGCIGVLAAEVRHGREAEPDTRAVVAMLAAQLSGIVAAWPAPSAPAPADAEAPAT